jgi:hypothetical protein
MSLMTHSTSLKSLEGLEESVDLGGGNYWTRVGNRYDSTTVHCADRNLDPAPYNIVPDRIVNQVGDESLDKVRIALQGRRRNGGINVESETVDTGTVRPKYRLRESGEVDSFAALHSPFATGEGKECFDKRFLLSIRIEQRFAGGSPYVRGGRVVKPDL